MIEQAEFIHVVFGILVDMLVVHEFNLIFGKRKVREAVVIFGHVYVREVRDSVAVWVKTPQAPQVFGFF